MYVCMHKYLHKYIQARIMIGVGPRQNSFFIHFVGRFYYIKNE